MKDKIYIKLKPADAFNYPYSGYAANSGEHYKELKVNKVQWANLRKKILSRQDFKCAYCMCDLHGKRMNVDHVIPLKRGGTNVASNLVAACPTCNKTKCNKVLRKFQTKELNERLALLKKESMKSTRRFKKEAAQYELDYQEEIGNNLRRMFM